MSRLGWFVLLLSLGINLGLGYRLFLAGLDQPRGAEGPSWQEGWERGSGPGRGGPDGGPDGPDGSNGPGGRRGGGGRWAGKDGRPALADTARMRRFMERRLESLVQRLDLNEDQRQSFADLHRQNGRRIIAQRGMVEEAREQLMGMLKVDSPQLEDVRQAVHRVGRQEALLDSLITESLLQEMDFLTPEQRQRYLQFLPGMNEHGPGSRRGPGGRDMRPPAED